MASRPTSGSWAIPDACRLGQLGLAALWLLDAVLQMQPYMFTRAFSGSMLAPVAIGNPSAVARSILWSAHQIGLHATLANSIFCLVQLLIALAIAWRPTLRLGLAASVVWSLGVWWIGEGFGEVLTSRASTLGGAPGAVVIYGVIAVLLWPRGESTRGDSVPGGRPAFVAARPFGAGVAQFVWLVVWLALAAFALSGADRTADGVSFQIARMSVAQPRWLAVLDGHLASGLAGHGLVASIVLAVACGVAAVGIFAPRSARRAVLALAALLAVVTWVVGEGFGGIFAGPATDPNTGAALLLLIAVFWPLRLRASAEVPA